MVTLARSGLPSSADAAGSEAVACGAQPPVGLQVAAPTSDRAFHRRLPVGRHVLPFVSPNPCAEAKLAIEIDGDTHEAPDHAAYDAARTAWLEERGSKVIRFDAGEVGRNLAGVLAAIRAACTATAANSAGR